MSAAAFNPELDLTLTRVIHAPRGVVWRAWTTPEHLATWWTPAPTQSRVERLDVRPGGAFVTQMSDDGETFVPHTDGIFLVVEAESRLVFTNAVTSALRPAAPAPISMVAEISFNEHPDGTEYVAVARHTDAAARALHADLGFSEGWGAVTEALGELSEKLAAH
ncbi:polyketide cyclase [Pseudoclavibacter sp. AY1F1]|uniref:SRPBCC domain-containing protein n=1 Tax=Pseudoclavibacter sp. AY1F1 TaxID=2080583 RepID=UPI000CE926E6|nr:SRPBCC domain-containing protein [Pseudoclavibacter sp. AY1F1]PPF44799.1 polyketide cyclase [Pseudoclavibacter sp. AY1F1]